MNPGDAITIGLHPGYVLTLTVPSGATGTLTQLQDSPGAGDPATPVVLNGANVTVGPFPVRHSFALVDNVGNITYSTAAYDEAASGKVFTSPTAGPVLKRGANGLVGTFVCNGATPVTVNNSNVAITDVITFSLNTVGGTVGAVPAVKTITAGVGFTVAGTASDTSTYNYAIQKNAA